ncbi:347_t:CDS:2 [Ambispora leptoticha]|uniref:347_t:CDS:1 n=1 Tax=Ambispora leptoticha TaxID=144679 RepID=A0A9N8ZVL5_9GLOM|nr:347_t:CDS:2 [Ambispora leptoticha]
MNLAVDDGDFEVLNQVVEIESDGYKYKPKMPLWGDDMDSGWKSKLDLDNEEQISTRLMIKKLGLIWNKNNTFEKKKRGPYMVEKVSKSTYFEKYGPSGIFIKATIGIAKITNYFIPQSSISSQFETVNLQLTNNSSESETEN